MFKFIFIEKVSKKERVKQLIGSGLNDIKAAKEVGLSRERIRQIRNYYGLKKNDSSHCSIISEEQLAEIMKLVHNGYSASHIKRKLNLPICDNTLRRLFKKLGIKYKINYKKIFKKQRWTPGLLAQFKVDYNNTSYTEVAIKYNISQPRVSQILNYKLGIFPRKKVSKASEKTIKRLQGL